MKKTLITSFFTFALALTAIAGNSVPNSATTPFEGKIVWKKDDGSKVTLKKSPSDPTSTAFMVTAATKVSVSGEAKSVADLKAGWTAKVTPKAGTPAEAASIEVSK